MSRGYKRINWKLAALIVLIGFTVAAAGFAVHATYGLKKSREKINILEEQLRLHQRVVYVAAEKLPRGTVITKENLRLETRYSDYPQAEFIAEDAIGMKVAQDITEGTCLMVSMLYPAEGQVREVFVAEVELPEHLQTGDRVDVRIRYNTAEDYIVLSDKELVKCDTKSGMVLRLTEEEILFLSSAIADCEIYEKTKLYVVEYPEYEQIETGNVTYIPNKEILTMLDRENTEGESRNALEQRLMQGRQ